MDRKTFDKMPVTDARSCLAAVDGSRASIDALIWTLRYATDHDLKVEVLTVWPSYESVLVREVPGHFCAPRWSARAAQDEAVRQALEKVTEPPVIATSLENADVAQAITSASARHELVVLGSTPDKHRHRLTERIVEDAHCEVVVVESLAGT